MAFGMTNDGFKPKRLADILDSLTNKIKSITDPDTGEHPFVNETADGILMQLASIVAEEVSVCWEQAYIASTQFDPKLASGASLRGLVQINGINPSYGSKTQIRMELGGITGTVIPKGSRISSVDNSKIYETTANATIENNGKTQVTAENIETGEAFPELEEIISIQSPIFGWNYAKNIALVSKGSNPDTDTDLHIKQERATSATSYRQVDAIVAGIANVPGVKFARLYVNNTTSTDSRGITGKTLAPVVVGGANEDIAYVLRLKSGSLDNFQGNVSLDYVGFLGDIQTVKFYRPEEVRVFMRIQISVTNSSTFPDNASDLIKKAIVDYAEYDQSGTGGFPPGTNVIHSRLYTPINSVQGFKVDELVIGTSTSSMSENDITINWNQIASFDPDDIEITVLN